MILVLNGEPVLTAEVQIGDYVYSRDSLLLMDPVEREALGVIVLPEPEPEPEPVRIDKVRFKNQLLTPAELVLFNAKRKEADALRPEDYTDPTKTLLVQAEILLDYMEDAVAIELDHPMTSQGISGLMVTLGILTPERATRILSNLEPEA